MASVLPAWKNSFKDGQVVRYNKVVKPELAAHISGCLPSLSLTLTDTLWKISRRKTTFKNSKLNFFHVEIFIAIQTIESCTCISLSVSISILV